MALRDKPNNKFGWFLDNETHHGSRVCVLVDRASTDTTNREGNYDTYNDTSVTKITNLSKRQIAMLFSYQVTNI